MYTWTNLHLEIVRAIYPYGEVDVQLKKSEQILLPKYGVSRLALCKLTSNIIGLHIPVIQMHL